MSEEHLRCPVCQAGSVFPFLEIPQVPVHCNLLLSSREEAEHVARDDLKLQFCSNCGHAYNSAFHPNHLNYNDKYQNPLHFSARFKDYNAQLIARLVDTYNLHDKDILEIGCGGGHFLNLICEQGNNRGIGFDPGCSTEQIRNSAERVQFIKEFFSAKTKGHKADVICCRHVLEHILHPRDFLVRVLRTLQGRPGAMVFFEVPNLDFVLKDLSIWDLIYEHCSYYTKHSLIYLFKSTGFKVCHLSETFGGQCLCIEAIPDENKTDPSIDDRNGTEQLFYDIEQFAEQYQAKMNSWRHRLREMDRHGKTVAVWGAGSKGVMFLNIPEAREQIRYAVDINPGKQGKYIPGGSQQIVSPARLKTYGVNVVIVMNPIYGEEIKGVLGHLGLNVELLYL